MCCCNSVAYQKRNQTQEGEINYENTNFKRALHSKYPCYYSFTNASFMSSFGSDTPFMLLAKLKVKEDKV